MAKLEAEIVSLRAQNMALRSGDPEILNGLLDEAGKGHDGGSLESESFWQTCSSRTVLTFPSFFF